MGDKERFETSDIYELIYSSSTEGILVCNDRGVIKMANDSLLKLFGYKKEELIGKNMEILIPAKYHKHHVGYRDNYMQSPKRRSMGIGRDLFGMDKKGKEFPLEISLNHMKVGSELYVMALITDISLRKEQEQKIRKLNQKLELKVNSKTEKLKESQILYQLIAKNFPNGIICVLNEELEFTFVEGEELTKNKARGQYLLNKKYIDFFPLKKKKEVQDLLKQVLEGNVVNFQITKGQNSYQVDAVPLIYGKNKKISQVLIVEHNVTKIKKLETKMKDSLLREKELNELKTKFISIASHEFRTPLSTILSSVSLIERYEELGQEENKKRHFDKIKKSISNLTNMLDDTLTISRIEENRINAGKVKMDVEEIAQDVINESEGLWSSEQAVILTFKGSNSITNDPKVLKIIFANLLSNALKYSKEDVIMELEVTSTQLKLMVEDKGIGIPKKEQNKLFERFYRANNVSNIQGTGLGLNIVQGYISVLNGVIKIESEENLGTKVIVDIPL